MVMDLLPEEKDGSVLFFENILKHITSSVIFNVCGMKGLRYSFEESKLHLWGFRVDAVKDTATAWDEGFVAQTLKEWELLSFAGNKQRYPSGSATADAFWRTIIRDTIRDYQNRENIRRANPTDEQAYLRFRSWLFGESGPHKASEMASGAFINFRKSFFIATQYQSFFTTKNGYIGLGESPQPNDEIWILFGGRVPFILRSHPAESHQAGSYFLVGDCYVHGIMDGEAMEGWRKTDMREVLLV
jgi:hypothetical protein